MSSDNQQIIRKENDESGVKSGAERNKKAAVLANMGSLDYKRRHNMLIISEAMYTTYGKFITSTKVDGMHRPIADRLEVCHSLIWSCGTNI